MLILATSGTPIMTIVIWIIILVIAFFARKLIGRTLFGIVFGALILFFTIFMIDNYTGHNLRNFIDISFYDNTIENPEEVASGILDKAKETGLTITDSVNKTGSRLDNELGIERKGDSGKEWSDKSEEPVKDEPVNPDTPDSDEQSSDESASKPNSTTKIIINYSDISAFIKANDLPEKDVEVLKSMTPSLKVSIKGEVIQVTNKDSELEQNEIMISLK